MELGFPEFQQNVVDPAQRARLRWTAVGIVGKQAGPREVEAEAGLVLPYILTAPKHVPKYMLGTC